MAENRLVKPDELKELSNEGYLNYVQSVLDGPVLHKYITHVEEAALKGFYGYEERLNSQTDMRELNVIRDHFQEHGYYCEFETRKMQNLLGEYDVQMFVIRWKE